MSGNNVPDTYLCKLDNGKIEVYDVAVGYRADVEPNPEKYTYIGKGYIHSINGVKSNDEQRYKFYRELL